MYREVILQPRMRDDPLGGVLGVGRQIFGVVDLHAGIETEDKETEVRTDAQSP